MDHSLDIWMLATSCVIFFWSILVTMYDGVMILVCH
jgi:hypothetical protein